MNGAQVVVDTLKRRGMRTVFGYPGGAIMPLYDALVDSGVRHILVRHEQAAAHAAEGYALASGGPGVCIATSGPGATNLVTGLADAYLDSVAVVAITGQVATTLLGSDAFQEVDAFGVTMPVVKHSVLARDPARLAESLEALCDIAMEGRKGPVHLDLPKDVQLAECPPGARPSMRRTGVDGDVAAAARMLASAKRPLFYAGGGLHQAGAARMFRSLAESARVPTVCTLKGLGVLPTGHPLLLGMMGMHGTPRANRALRDCDLLFVAGARFDDRATGKLAEFCPGAKVVHFDIDPAEVGKLRRPDVSVVGDLAVTLPMLMDELDPGDPWLPKEPEPRAEWTSETPCPRDILETIDADIVATDVGQHQMWAAQFLRFRDGMRFLTSGGLGTMGFGLPAAIGAQCARPESRVVCVTGDGSLMMMVHELATLRRYQLPVKIVLFDNGCLGMVRQWQELFFGNRESEVDLSDNPDFLDLAAVFGIPGRRVMRNADVRDAMADAMESDGPFLLHCAIERGAGVWPLVPPGRANHEFRFAPDSGASQNRMMSR